MKYLIDTNICIYFLKGKFDLITQFDQVGFDNLRSLEHRQKMSANMEKVLSIMMSEPDDGFWPFLEKLRAEADKKGFSDEMLDEILSE